MYKQNGAIGISLTVLPNIHKSFYWKQVELPSNVTITVLHSA